MKLSQLPVGALVKYPNTKYNNDVIIWQVLEHGHSGDPSGSTTLQSRDILTLKCFDAKEPSNSNNDRKNYGNNRYKYSNILQWLNSDKNSWYEAQHSADQEPSSSYVSGNAYDSEAGFLTNFSDKFKKALLSVSNTTVVPTIDGGGSEIVESKVFLISTTEVGLANESSIAEGSIYSLYNTSSYRIKNLSNDAAKGNYSYATSPWTWWLRTPGASNSNYVRVVHTDGTLGGNFADGGDIGVAPALCISSDTEVSDTPDASNVYTLQFAPSCVKVYIGDENGEAKLVWEQEHEIEALVPVMTSNTTPSGVASASSVASSSYAAWKAFDGVSSTNSDAWVPANNATNNYIQYQFENAVIPTHVSLETYHSNTPPNIEFTVQGSNDGTNWSNIGTLAITSATNTYITDEADLDSSNSVLYIRLFCESKLYIQGNYALHLCVLQFYGYKA